MTEHVITIVETADVPDDARVREGIGGAYAEFTPKCTCGWEGDTEDRKADAKSTGAEHVAGTKPCEACGAAAGEPCHPGCTSEQWREV